MSTKLLGSDNEDDITTIDSDDYSDISELQGDIDAQLDAVIGEFAGEKELSAKIKIYKIEKGQGKQSWVFDCLPDELPILERVRDEYGPGDYSSRLYVGGILKKKFPFSIATPRRVSSEVLPKQNSDVNALADVIKQSMDSFRDLIIQNNAQQTQHQPPTMMEMIQQMVAMKELLGVNQAKGSPIQDLRAMMELVDDLRGEKSDDKPNGIMDVLGGLIDKTLPALTGAMEQERQLPSSDIRSNPSVRPTQRKEKNNVNLQMKMQLGFLCSMASKNADPSTYAGLIIDQSNPDQLEKLVKIVEQNDWLDQFGKINPNVLQFREWFESLKIELLGELFPEDQSGDIDTTQDPDDTTPDETGNQKEYVSSTTENKDDNNA